jgi:arylformamidase
MAAKSAAAAAVESARGRTSRRRAAGEWIDVSVPILDGMPVWPGDPPVRISLIQAIARGDPANLSAVSLGAHTGTHVDGPRHFVDGAPSIDTMPAAMMIGRARVLAIGARDAIRPEHLAPHRVRRGERVLLRTRNSPRAWRAARFVEDAVHLTPAAAEHLAAHGVALVGIDYLSVGGYGTGEGEAVHRTLLAAGIWIVEGLDLARVPAGPCELACLPLRIAGGDGAPARALVRPIRRSRETRA